MKGAGRAFLLLAPLQSEHLLKGFTLMDQERLLAEVYFGDYMQASVIKGLLETYGIVAFVREERLGVELPSYYVGASGRFKVLVYEEDYHIAKSILEAPADRPPDAAAEASEPT